MKKLITTAAFLMFGTMVITAQTTKKKNSPSTMPDKPANSTEMKIENNTVQPNGMNRTIDTATMNNRSKMQTNPNRLQQNQTMPNNGTLQNPNTTMPNNGTMQNPNTTMPNNGTLQNPNTTMPNNSTATPQVQPVSPLDTSKPTR
jgi:hypothetical protein